MQPKGPTPYFLEKLGELRRADAVSGRSWSGTPGLSAHHASAMGHIDRTTEGLKTALMLLQASETCRRRRPEDFGIGDDLHEGLVFIARELAYNLRTHVDTMETRWIKAVADTTST